MIFLEKNKYLHIVFIDIEKTYNRALRDIFGWVSERKKILKCYFEIVKDMYVGVIIIMRILGGDIN